MSIYLVSATNCLQFISNWCWFYVCLFDIFSIVYSMYISFSMLMTSINEKWELFKGMGKRMLLLFCILQVFFNYEFTYIHVPLKHVTFVALISTPLIQPLHVSFENCVMAYFSLGSVQTITWIYLEFCFWTRIGKSPCRSIVDALQYSCYYFTHVYTVFWQNKLTN